MKIVTYTNQHYKENMSYSELRHFFNSYGPVIEEFVSITGDKTKYTIGSYTKTLRFVGKTCFIKTTCRDSFSYSKNKFYGHVSDMMIPYLFEYLNISWYKELYNKYTTRRFFTNKSILKSIISGNIYSEETFYKAIGKRIYKLKDFSWKIIRMYCENLHISLFDLKDFTKNYEESIKVICDPNIDMSKYQLLNDMIRMAANENSVIDCTWSDKRLAAEHKAQIERANRARIEILDKKSVYSDSIEKAFSDSQIKLLNNELEVYTEALNMHHCLYNCYWDRIKAKNYIAFHMNFPEDCTFGVILNNNGGRLDQIYLKYDQNVKASTQELAKEYILAHEDLFKKIYIEKEIEIENALV